MGTRRREHLRPRNPQRRRTAASDAGKYDVVAVFAEELPRPEMTEEITHGDKIALELKEVADANMTDDDPQRTP